MIPSILAGQIRRSLEDYLRATFPITTPFFHDLLDRFLGEPGNLFKGPFLSVQLPFRKGATGRDFFTTIKSMPHGRVERDIKDDTILTRGRMHPPRQDGAVLAGALPGGPLSSGSPADSVAGRPRKRTIVYEAPFDC